MAETIKKCRNGLMYIILLLLILIIAAIGYLYYRGMEYKEHANFEIHQLSMKSMEQNKLMQIAIYGLENKSAIFNSRLNQLDINKSALILFQVNELISLANQSILVYNDIPASIRLLNYAKNALEAENSASFVGLKYALANDITKLQNLPAVDKVMLNGQLDAILDHVTAIHLISDITNSNNISSINNSNTSTWLTFVNNIKTTLLGLISINDSNSDKYEVLLPKQEVLLKDILKVDLLGAKIALIENDQAGWEYNLNSAKSKLINNFINYSGINQLIEQLSGLSQMNVSNPQANIDATLTALNKLITTSNLSL
ncbi:MAG: uroporphyrinogen-III C-methyltransferase [Burkholderiales bacterium]|nr:uroporphyrinogen-III C-methyltransferase [Burkholderiales bacterium]